MASKEVAAFVESFSPESSIVTEVLVDGEEVIIIDNGQEDEDAV